MKGRSILALGLCITVPALEPPPTHAKTKGTQGGTGGNESCYAAMLTYDRTLRERERVEQDAAELRRNAIKAVEGAEARIKALQEDRPDGGLSDAGAGELARLASEELPKLREAVKRAEAMLATARSERESHEDAESNTCVPQWAGSLGPSFSWGADAARRIGIDGAFRFRTGPRTAGELFIGYTHTLRISPTLASDHSVLVGGNVRFGRGYMGDVYLGPAIVASNGNGPSSWSFTFVRTQIGYSWSPARDGSGRVAGDLRLFMEPWFPLNGKEAAVLFGFGVGIVGHWTTARR